MTNPLHKGVEIERPMEGSLWQSALLSSFLAVAYLGLGMAAFSMPVAHVNVTCMAFFPEGVSLLFIILFGPRVAPGVFLGQFVLGQWTGLSPSASAFIGVSNALQGILGGWLFRRWRISPTLRQPRDVALLFVICGGIIQPLSATGGVMGQLFFTGLPWERVGEVWMSWWAGNTLGQMLVLPLALTWTRGSLSGRERSEVSQALLAVGAYLLLVFLYAFGETEGYGTLLRLLFFGLFYLTLMWVAVQSGVRTVSLINLLVTGPFLWVITTSPDLLTLFASPSRLLFADVFVMASIVTALLVSALWEQLADRRRQLREANAARERLFSVIGHDLSAPIATLETSLDLLIAGDLSPEEFRGFQHDLRQGVSQARQTLRNLMEWGNQQMTAARPQLAQMSLRIAATEAAQLLALIAEQKSIRVENLIPDEAVVEADMNQIQSVLRNLLANALKFTPEGGRVTLTSEYRSGSWHTSITDTGVGMPPKRAARIFQPDNEYVSTPGTADERGLGLGLQLCRDFIAAHKGGITVQSRENEGTTFTFSLATTVPKPSRASESVAALKNAAATFRKKAKA